MFGGANADAGHADDGMLYLAGLKGMLKEMRKRRPPDTPFGHTQHLQVHFRKGTKVSKVHIAKCAYLQAATVTCTPASNAYAITRCFHKYMPYLRGDFDLTKPPQTMQQQSTARKQARTVQAKRMCPYVHAVRLNACP